MNVNAREGGGYKHRVWLDGEEVSSLGVEADDVEGYVVMVVRKDGKTQLTEDRRAILTETKRGAVRIECMKSPCGYCVRREAAGAPN